MHEMNRLNFSNGQFNPLFKSNEGFSPSVTTSQIEFSFEKMFFQNVKSFTNLIKNYVTFGIHIDERVIQNHMDLKLKKIEMFSDRGKLAEKWGFEEPCVDGIGKICAMAKTQIQINTQNQSANRIYQLFEPNKCYI